jgi:chemotaxis signal transduction protein
MTHLDEQTRQLLRLRASELAKRGHVEERRSVGEPVAVFLAGRERIGLPVSSLLSVIRVPPITEVPELPQWMPGLVQVRGTLMTVIDISLWLGLPQRTAPAYVALLEESRRPLGLLVEGVAGVREIFADEISEQRGAGEADGTLPIQFTTRDLVAILDIRRLFAVMDRRRQQAASSSSRQPPGDHS